MNLNIHNSQGNLDFKEIQTIEETININIYRERVRSISVLLTQVTGVVTGVVCELCVKYISE